MVVAITVVITVSKNKEQAQGGQLRVFFAVWLDADTLTAVEAVQSRLLDISGGRLIVPETIHLTLSFVGDIMPERLDELVAIGNQIRLPPFQFCINKISCSETSRVAWASSKQVPEALMNLQSTLDSLVVKAGFPLDLRPFRPHITLLRNLPHPFTTMSTQDFIWPITAFSLVEARKNSGGAPYKILQVWPLHG